MWNCSSQTFDRFVNGLWQTVVRSQQAWALGIATASWKTGRKMSKEDLKRLKVEREAMLSILGFNPRMSKHQKGALKTCKCGSNRSYWMFRKHRDWRKAWKAWKQGHIIVQVSHQLFQSEATMAHVCDFLTDLAKMSSTQLRLWLKCKGRRPSSGFQYSWQERVTRSAQNKWRDQEYKVEAKLNAERKEVGIHTCCDVYICIYTICINIQIYRYDIDVDTYISIYF